MDFCQQLQEEQLITFFGLDTSPIMQTIFQNAKKLDSFSGDNLITFGRSLTFFEDQKFCQAIIGNSEHIARAIIWRQYVGCQLAYFAAHHIPGDLVECGSGQDGIFAGTVLQYLEFEKIDKEFYMYDSYEGAPRDQTNSNNHYEFEKDDFQEVKNKFSKYHNVHIYKGFLPEALEDTPIVEKKISFLHIDLGHFASEKNTLKFFLDKNLFSDYAIVLFQNFGQKWYQCFKIKDEDFLLQKKIHILEIPTGQGIMIIPPRDC